MNQQAIILVTGATGAQGGSVVQALLKQRKFKVRALTRERYSAKAEKLAKAGAEIIEGDFYDTGILREAMKSCYGVFGVTSYWEDLEKDYR